MKYWGRNYKSYKNLGGHMLLIRAHGTIFIQENTCHAHMIFSLSSAVSPPLYTASPSCSGPCSWKNYTATSTLPHTLEYWVPMDWKMMSCDIVPVFTCTTSDLWREQELCELLPTYLPHTYLLCQLAVSEPGTVSCSPHNVTDGIYTGTQCVNCRVLYHTVELVQLQLPKDIHH